MVLWKGLEHLYIWLWAVVVLGDPETKPDAYRKDSNILPEPRTVLGTWKVFYHLWIKAKGRPRKRNHTNKDGPRSPKRPVGPVTPHLAATASSSWFSFC